MSRHLLRRCLRGLQSAWLHPLNDPRVLDALLRRLHPLWSLRQVRARVIAVVEETADTRSYLLRPNRHWRGHQAGQHVSVEVEIDGARQRRSYSLSNAPGEDLRLTVKRQAGSRVSAWLHRHVRVGAVLAMSPAQGEFGLPAALDAAAPLLLLSAGSGITPMMALLEQLRRQRHQGPIRFVHSCRGEAELIFATRLRELQLDMPNLALQLHDSRAHGRLDAVALARLAPDHLASLSFLCGPAPFMRWVQARYREAGAADRLHGESFGFAALESAHDGSAHAVRCVGSARDFVSSGRNLLLEAEQAGLQPAYGCRAGICRTCLCHKREGRVENLLTGAVSDQPGQWIQLCISVARSPVELDL